MIMLGNFVQMIFGKVYHKVALVIAVSIAMTSFFNGNAGNFARASGVLLFILFENIQFGEFLLKFVQLVFLNFTYLNELSQKIV